MLNPYAPEFISRFHHYGPFPPIPHTCDFSLFTNTNYNSLPPSHVSFSPNFYHSSCSLVQNQPSSHYTGCFFNALPPLLPHPHPPHPLPPLMETPGARAAVMEIPNERVENKETFDKSQGERFICWRPKARYGEKSRNRHDKFRERSDNDLNPFKIKEIDGQHSTVMIKNIPNKCSWRRLLDFLDEHCIQENEKIKKVGSNAQEMFSEYDFLYLPMDFKNKCNLGYAFVNFTSAMGAWKLYNKLNGYQWKVYSSKKICEVTYARIQGKQALVKHFCGSTFMCNCDDYLPHLFSPPRNGSALSESITVGRRLHRFHP